MSAIHVRLSVAMALLWAASTLCSRAQSLYLSNLDQPLRGNAFTYPATPLWQSFVTGPNAGGYRLDKIRIRAAQQVAGGGFAMTLAADNSGSPGATLTTLSGPTPPTGSSTTNTYTAGLYPLQPSTKYWIGMSASSGNFDWYYPTSTTFVAIDGWSYATRLGFGVTQPNNYFLDVEAASADQLGEFYFQDFSDYTNNATSFSDGSTLYSTHPGSVAGLRDATIKELQLTEKGSTAVLSAYVLPEFNTNIVYAFSAKWSAIVDGNFPSAADGFSFNFGRTAGLNLTDTNIATESGYGVGISIGFQTYSGNQAGFHVRAGSNHLAYVPIDPGVFWGVNANRRNFIEVDWHHRDGLTLRINQTTIFANVPTYGFYPQRGSRFFWAARNGGLSEQVRLDNIVVATGGLLARETPSSPYYDTPGGLNIFSAFDNNDATEWQSYTSMNTSAGTTLSTTRSYRVYAVTSAGSLRSRDPRDWELQATTNGGGQWFTLDTRTGYFANGSETRAYLATNELSFRSVRLNVVTNYGSSIVFLGELRNYRFTPVADAPGPEPQASINPDGYGLIVCSADGRYVYSTLSVANDNIERSDDFGVTWNNSGASNQFFMGGIACSAAGRHVIVVGQSARIQYSSDGGQTFTQLNSAPLSINGTRLGISSNGTVLLMAGNSVAYSLNSGTTWSSTNLVGGGWSRAVMSDSGQFMYALGGSYLYSSTNFGTTWVSNNVGSTTLRDMACSADGQKAVVAVETTLRVTGNGGATWTVVAIPGETRSFRSVACSGDGQRMFVLDRTTGRIRVFHSTDAGSTWTLLLDDPGRDWRAIACSRDGQFLYITHATGCDTFRLLPKPPYVEGAYVDTVGPFDATLVAQVRPFGAPTRVFFSYGVTTNMGSFVTATAGSSTGIEVVTVSVPLSGLQTNATYYYRPAATNGTSPVFSVGDLNSFTTLSLAGMDAWRYQYFGTTNNTGSAADTADPDGDRSQNLLEFAAGSHPGTTNASPLFRVGESNGALRIYFTRNVNADGYVVWEVESTPALTNAWSNRNGTLLEAGSNGVLRIMQFTPDGATPAAEHYRLKVSRP